MKKTALFIYIIIFLLVCITPSLLTLFGVESVNAEKRELASMPMLIENGVNLDFTEEFDAFFSDNFALRPYLVTGYAKILKTMFKTSASDQVVVGKEGFLYFSQTIADYTGESALSDDEVNAICDRLKAASDLMAEHNIAFYFTVAPNKNTIYPEYMPNRYVRYSGESNITRIYDGLNARGVNYIDLVEDLLLEKQRTLVYYRLDSHWNDIGALIAYNRMLGEIQKALPDVAQVDFLAKEKRTSYTHSGDVAGMLYPVGDNMDAEVVFDYEKTFTSDRPLVNKDPIQLKTESQANDVSAMIFRDSFFVALQPYFSESFGEVEFSRAVPYDFEYAATLDVDMVLVEIVERNIPALLDILSNVNP